MERIALILLMFVLLMNGRHPEPRPSRRTQLVTVSAEALPLFLDDPTQRRLGDLVYLGGWALTSDNPDFGSISSMTVDAAGWVRGLSDGGQVMLFHPGGNAFRATVAPVPVLPDEIGAPRWHWDTESMTLDPVTGRIWVGFEGIARICRYAPDFRRVEACAEPPAVARWPEKTGMESLARLPDGRFVAIAENSPGPQGGHDVLLFAGDPVDPATPPPARLTYRAPVGYWPTDAIVIGGDRMLILNRRLTLADFFTAVLVEVDLRGLRPGGLLDGRVIARLEAPVLHDNFEALAVSREQGRDVLWIASDDNGLFFQQSLLLKFALPIQQHRTP